MNGSPMLLAHSRVTGLEVERGVAAFFVSWAHARELLFLTITNNNNKQTNV